jgi:hypothetical protein
MPIKSNIEIKEVWLTDEWEKYDGTTTPTPGVRQAQEHTNKKKDLLIPIKERDIEL